MSLGALGYVGYAKEVTEGTAVAPSIFLPVSSFGFEDTNDYIVPAQIRGSRDSSVAMAAPFNVSGSMEMELIPQGVGVLLNSAFATAATHAVNATEPTATDHTFVPGSAVPTMTFESNAADILVMRYTGVKVNTLEIKAAFGEIVTATFGLEGVGRAKQGSASTEDYANVDADPFHFTGAEMLVEGAQLAHLKEFTFGVNNNIERIGTLRKTRTWKRMALGMREVMLSGTLDFTDTSEYDRFLAEEEFEVDLNLEGGAVGAVVHKLALNVPRVKWNKVGVPISAGDYLEQAVEAMILKPTGADIFTAVLTNDEATF